MSGGNHRLVRVVGLNANGEELRVPCPQYPICSVGNRHYSGMRRRQRLGVHIFLLCVFDFDPVIRLARLFCHVNTLDLHQRAQKTGRARCVMHDQSPILTAPCDNGVTAFAFRRCAYTCAERSLDGETYSSVSNRRLLGGDPSA